MDLFWKSRTIRDKAFAIVKGMDISANWLLLDANRDFARFASFDGDISAPIPFLFTPLDQKAADFFNQLKGIPSNGSQFDFKDVYLFSDFVGGSDVQENDIEIGQTVVAFAWLEFFFRIWRRTLTNSKNIENIEDFDEVPFDEDPPSKEFQPAEKLITISPPIRAESWFGFQENPELKQPTIVDPATPPLATGSEQDDPLVVMAVIDDGIGIAHERFRAQDNTTRVQYFWHMGLTPGHTQTVPWGREFWKGDGADDGQSIDPLLVRADFDEARFYRLAGISDRRRQGQESLETRFTHGTHVLDAMAGDDPANDTGNRPIIAVQLPPDVVENSSGAMLDAHLGAAIEYIRARAAKIAEAVHPRPVAVVVNLSYGYAAGPHDGTKQIERFMDQEIERDGTPPMRIVVSAGNANLSRCFAQIPPPEPDPDDVPGKATLAWRILPDDRTQSELQIWLPKRPLAPPGTTPVSVQLVPPQTEASERLKETRISGSPDELLLKRRGGATDGQVLGREPVIARVRRQEDKSSGCIMYSIRVMQTARDFHENADVAKRVVPSGAWQVNFEFDPAEINVESPIHIWIQRDDTIYGFPSRGRQSHFEHADYPPQDFTSGYALTDVPSHVPVRRQNLLSAIATGRKTVVVGGFEWRELRALPISAGGPLETRVVEGENEDTKKPDALVLASDSLVHLGVLAAGTRSSSEVAMLGTSAAAPLAARILADTYDPDQAATWGREAIANLAKESEVELTNLYADLPPLPEDHGGHGRLVPTAERRSEHADRNERGVKRGLRKLA